MLHKMKWEPILWHNFLLSFHCEDDHMFGSLEKTTAQMEGDLAWKSEVGQPCFSMQKHLTGNQSRVC